MIRKGCSLAISSLLILTTFETASACGLSYVSCMPHATRRLLVHIDNRTDLEESCKYIDYDLVVYGIPGPHFFLGAIPQDSSSNDCPKLGFYSMNGRNSLVKGEDDNVDGVIRYDLHTERPYKLHEILKVFDEAEPIIADGFDLEYNTCVHFIGRMTRPLGVPETKEVGDFLVESLLADENLIKLARKHHGGTAVMAARILGTEIFRDYIENLVFSQLILSDDRNLRHGADETIAKVEFDASKYGIETAFETNPDNENDHNTRFLDEVCYNELYDVDIIIEQGSVAMMLEPTENATKHGCKYHWFDATMDKDGYLTKESFRFNDIFDLHDQLSEVHGTIMTTGKFRLGSVVNAYESASVCAAGHEGEGFDILSNNLGDFVANVFLILGHKSSHIETMLIASALMLSMPDLASYIHANADNPDLVGKPDAEVVEWLVEQRTRKMYETMNPSIPST